MIVPAQETCGCKDNTSHYHTGNTLNSLLQGTAGLCNYVIRLTGLFPQLTVGYAILFTLLSLTQQWKQWAPV